MSYMCFKERTSTLMSVEPILIILGDTKWAGIKHQFPTRASQLDTSRACVLTARPRLHNCTLLKC